MKIGMVGLGRMGAGMTERIRKHGHEVVGYDHSGPETDVGSLEELVAALEPPRVIWTMIPAGDPTEETVKRLGELLSKDDIVVDGGNSNYGDSQRRGTDLADNGIGYIDAGVSGGIWGEENGYCLMVGGDPKHVAVLQPIFDALAPEGGYVYAGKLGAGHYTKMVHNGIEYGLMQAYGEGYELLCKSELVDDVPGALAAWRYGSVVRSWLLDLLVSQLEDDHDLSHVRGYAEDSGEGRWTVAEGIRLGVPTPAIAAALYARFLSRMEESTAMKVVAALRRAFGGHAVKQE